MLIATHDLNEAAARFPLMWLLNRRLIAGGPPAEVLTPQNLALAYGGQIHVVRSDNGHVYLTDSCCDGGHPPVAPLLAGASEGSTVLGRPPQIIRKENELR